MRPDYPDLFISPTPQIESPLHWDTDPVKLKELLTALDVDKAISTLSGEKAPFTAIVERFEQFLHVKLGTAAEVKPPEICWPTFFAKPPCRTCPVIGKERRPLSSSTLTESFLTCGRAPESKRKSRKPQRSSNGMAWSVPGWFPGRPPYTARPL